MLSRPTGQLMQVSHGSGTPTCSYSVSNRVFSRWMIGDQRSSCAIQQLRLRTMLNATSRVIMSCMSTKELIGLHMS
jgi:hypothetical protein